MNRIPKDIMITRQDLIDWLDKPLSNEDMDLIDYIVNRLENFYKLDEEIDRLNKIIDEFEKELKSDLDVYICSRQNGKTFRYAEKLVKSMLLDRLQELKEEGENNAKEEEN